MKFLKFVLEFTFFCLFMTFLAFYGTKWPMVWSNRTIGSEDIAGQSDQINFLKILVFKGKFWSIDRIYLNFLII